MGIHVCMYNLFPLLQPLARLTPSWAPVSARPPRHSQGPSLTPVRPALRECGNNGRARLRLRQHRISSPSSRPRSSSSSSNSSSRGSLPGSSRVSRSLEICWACSITQAQNSATLAACFIHSPNNPVYHDWKRQFLLFQLDVNLVGRD